MYPQISYIIGKLNLIKFRLHTHNLLYATIKTLLRDPFSYGEMLVSNQALSVNAYVGLNVRSGVAVIPRATNVFKKVKSDGPIIMIMKIKNIGVATYNMYWMYGSRKL